MKKAVGAIFGLNQNNEKDYDKPNPYAQAAMASRRSRPRRPEDLNYMSEDPFMYGSDTLDHSIPYQSPYPSQSQASSARSGDGSFTPSEYGQPGFADDSRGLSPQIRRTRPSEVTSAGYGGPTSYRIDVEQLGSDSVYTDQAPSVSPSHRASRRNVVVEFPRSTNVAPGSPMYAGSPRQQGLPPPLRPAASTTSSDRSISDTYPVNTRAVDRNTHAWLFDALQKASDSEDYVSTGRPWLMTLDEEAELHPNPETLYKILKPWQTRLLVLHPAEKFESPLSCTLLEVDVIDSRGFGISGTSVVAQYEALSYAWGSPDLVCSVMCNDMRIGIGYELANALHFLRSKTDRINIWCDALCINQGDLDEKARQVRNMLRIFEKADRVIAWLGATLPGSGMLNHALKSIISKPLPIVGDLEEDDRQLLQQLLEAFRGHLSSDWFVRTWVRQEVFAAKQMVVQFGHYRVNFEYFVQQVEYLNSAFQNTLFIAPNLIPPTLSVFKQEYQHCGTDRHDFRMQAELSSYVLYWRSVLGNGSLFKVSDERDRIYGALGLLTSVPVKFLARLPAPPEQLAADFPVDYSKSVQEVYQDVTKFLINSTGNLEVLGLFRPRAMVAEKKDWPSWVMVWRSGEDHCPISHPIDKQTDDVSQLQQAYSEVGKLRLRGVRVCYGLALIDARKKMTHPFESAKPTYKDRYAKLSLADTLPLASRGARRNLTDYDSLIFVCTQLEETEASFRTTHSVTPLSRLDQRLANLFSGNDYVFAFVWNEVENLLNFSALYLLVPRIAALTDIVVSLYGSSTLHLLRPTLNSEYQYIGPVAEIADSSYVGSSPLFQDIKGVGTKQQNVSKAKLSELGKKYEAETFVLI